MEEPALGLDFLDSVPAIIWAKVPGQMIFISELHSSRL